jgi:phosphatidylglycerophosphate synthase
MKKSAENIWNAPNILTILRIALIPYITGACRNDNRKKKKLYNQCHLLYLDNRHCVYRYKICARLGDAFYYWFYNGLVAKAGNMFYIRKIACK